MIKKYSHKTIDRDKYTSYLQQTINYRIYAELWYLDIVSPNGYDILVLNNFEAVMPIPYQKKLGFKFILQPPFCQQLGIFYKHPISSENFEKLLFLLKKYRVRGYNFNEENTEYFSSEYKRRNNQVLNLNHPYYSIYETFSSNRRREIKKLSSKSLNIDKKFNISYIVYLLKANTHIFSQEKITIAEKLLKGLAKQGHIESVHLKIDNELIASCTFLISKNRLISLFPLRLINTSEKGAITYLYNYIIRKYSNSNKTIDFEGSTLMGIEKFNSSFGACVKQYVTYRNFKWFENLKNYTFSNHFN